MSKSDRLFNAYRDQTADRFGHRERKRSRSQKPPPTETHKAPLTVEQTALARELLKKPEPPDEDELRTERLKAMRRSPIT